MRYGSIAAGTFLARPNRFIAHVDVEGTVQVCHVKNTGRCRELLVPKAKVYLERHLDAAAKGRKTEYSVIGVEKERPGKPPLLINMDSQAPNQAAFEWVAGGGLAKFGTVTELRREVRFGNSRIDLAFLLDGKPALMEVKGVTLEEDGLALFPDAPTERGVRHLEELSAAVSQGFSCFVLFVIQMKEIACFSPNRATHPAFADALIRAEQAGVRILAMDCLAGADFLAIDAPVPVDLGPNAGTDPAPKAYPDIN